MKMPSLDKLRTEFQDVITDGVPRVSRGDVYMLDDYVLLLQELGYDVDYENIYDGYGFIAQVTIDGENHALWQGGITGIDHSVLVVQNSIDRFEKSNR